MASWVPHDADCVGHQPRVQITILARGEILAGGNAQSDIVPAGGVVKERLNTAGRVGLASSVLIKRLHDRWPCCR